MSDGEPEEQAPQADPPATSESTPESTPERATRPARRKKRRRAVAREVVAEEPEGDEAGAEAPPEDDGVPAFARAFPREPALDALVAAFEAGDYARVRREAPALARGTDDAAVRAAARTLRRRLDPDPIAVYLLAAAALLLTFLAGWYWAHPHTP